MNRPSSQSKPTRSWHRRIEQYTPDGVLGRLVFAAAMGPVITFFVWLAGIGVLGYGTFSLLLFLAAAIAGIGATFLGLLVLWPVYLWLIGNIESPQSYANAGSTGSLDVTDSDDSVATLKQRYADGEMGDEEFEQRLDALLEMEGGSSLDSSNPSRSEDPTAKEFDWN